MDFEQVQIRESSHDAKPERRKKAWSQLSMNEMDELSNNLKHAIGNILKRAKMNNNIYNSMPLTANEFVQIAESHSSDTTFRLTSITTDDLNEIFENLVNIMPSAPCRQCRGMIVPDDITSVPCGKSCHLIVDGSGPEVWMYYHSLDGRHTIVHIIRHYGKDEELRWEELSDYPKSYDPYHPPR